MNLMELAIKVGVEDDTKGGLDSISSSTIARGVAIGNAMWDVTKQVAGAAGNAVKSIVGGALEAYSSYEQLSGGVKKLFGDAASTVMANADQAYKTSGMSANAYMEQATSFSASLINSLGGDTQKAAQMTDVAMRAMSDNVNTFGSNAEDVSNAFNGFAKQNYTMLDNLKLGYGGTKEEMERLIKDANEWGAANGEASDLSIDSFADVVQAIQQIQEKQGIAGTTAKEAATTIEGSINMVKGAWENWIAGLGNEQADMGQLTSNLLEAVGDVIQNVAPRLGLIVSTIVGELPSVVAQAAQALPGMLAPIGDTIKTVLGDYFGIDTGPLEEKLGSLSQLFQDTFGSIDLSPVQQLMDGLASAGQALMDTLGGIDLTGLFQGLSDGVQGFLDMIAPVGDIMAQAFADPAVQEALQHLADLLGVVASVAGPVLGAVIQALVATFAGLVVTVSQVIDGISAFVQAIVQLFTGDVPGAIDTMTSFFANLPGSIGGFLQGVIDAVVSWVASMLSNAQQAGSGFLQGVVSFFTQLPGQVASFLSSVISSVVGWVSQMASNARQAGQQFVQNVANFLTQLPGQIAGWLAQAIAAIGTFVSSMGSKAREAGQSFLNGIKGGLNAAVDFVRGIPGAILSALGNVGSLLFNAGASILRGFLDGLKSMWGNVTSFVGNIAGWIASHKGPIDYDRRLLIPAGNAIMAGLLGGLTSGFAPVMDYVSGMAGEMSDAFGTPSLPVGVEAVPAAAVAGAAQGQAQAPVVNVYINDARINDDEGVKDAVMDLFGELKRIADMDQG